MYKSIKNLGFILIISLLMTVTSTNAQNVQEKISPEKKAAIKELLEVTEAKTNSDNVLNTMFAQMENLMPQLLATQIENSPEVKAEDRAETSKKASEVSSRVFNRFKELTLQKVKFSEITEQISYELYDKYFTQEELKDLIIFYKSPTGKKATKALPLLVEESSRKTNQILTPVIQQIMLQVLDEEKNRLIKQENVNK